MTRSGVRLPLAPVFALQGDEGFRVSLENLGRISVTQQWCFQARTLREVQMMAGVPGIRFPGTSAVMPFTARTFLFHLGFQGCPGPGKVGTNPSPDEIPGEPKSLLEAK